MRLACQRLVGAYAIAVIDHTQPGQIIVAREGSPLLLGVSDSGNYAASDASALLQVTRNMVYLENGDIAELSADNVTITRLDGTLVDRPVHVSQLSAAAVELGTYRHYMQKEIFEQPRSPGQHPGNRRRQQDHPARHFRCRSRRSAGRCRTTS